MNASGIKSAHYTSAPPAKTKVYNDYGGDGISDMPIMDNANGHWYIRSVAGSVIAWAVAWGWPGAMPVPGDYDDDGKYDLAVFDTNTGPGSRCPRTRPRFWPGMWAGAGRAQWRSGRPYTSFSRREAGKCVK